MMPSTTPLITCTAAPLSDLDADLLVIPWFEQEGPDAFGELDRATGGEISRALASKEFTAKPFELFVTRLTDPRWKARRVGLCGAGRRERFDIGVARHVAATAGLAARQRHAEHLAILVRAALDTSTREPDAAGTLQAAGEGLTLAEFDGGSYKTERTSPDGVSRWTIALGEGIGGGVATAVADAAVARGRLLGECSNLARNLSNEPGNTLTPREFAGRASAIAASGGVSVDTLDERQMEALGMGLLLGVARGSSEPPRLMVFRHEPRGVTSGPVLGLVGKGVTFDSGGISIKPADGMERMKDDMAGGAAVACAMLAIARLGAPIRVVGVVPAVENMPGGRAIRPGDVLRSAEGKTVEVINTDAEGRLILGDALWYARRIGATHLVDVATLTGAIVVALGKSVSGIFGTPEGWVDEVRRVADRAGDRMWPMPTFDEYREQLNSDIADFANTGGRPAGSVTAAMFLKEFTGGLPWAHLDIAGTAWAEDAKPYLPKGPSGVGVRTLAELAFTAESWPT
jgi:leucyl aminopeptidase